ncbi:Tyrosine-protein kinase [Toxocara canis]|uniref:Tyrosine-protein kinase n=1 Tax=Toxocara canis TaxID=6265 RepID=A0A0B2VHG5_TOXCA|nr:Tyrosine-protein kinase [Toxocara canis]
MASVYFGGAGGRPVAGAVSTYASAGGGGTSPAQAPRIGGASTYACVGGAGGAASTYLGASGRPATVYGTSSYFAAPGGAPAGSATITAGAAPGKSTMTAIGAPTGASTMTAIGAVPGRSTMTAIGAPTGASTMTAIGTPMGASTMTAIGAAPGKSTMTAIGAPAGASTMTAIGAVPGKSTMTAIGTPMGASTMTAIGAVPGQSTMTAIGAPTGASTMTAIGAVPGKSTMTAIGTPMGASTMTAIGAAPGRSTMTAIGAPTGASTMTAIGTVPGKSTMTAIGTPMGASTMTAIGAAPGRSTMTAIGAPTGASTMTAIGTVPGKSTMTAIGTPMGASTMTAVGAPMGASTMTAVGAVPGKSTMTAVGGPIGASAMMTAMAGPPTGASTMTAIGAAPGRSTMTAIGAPAGASTMTAIGAVPGKSTMTAIGTPMGASTMTAVPGQSNATAVVTLTGATVYRMENEFALEYYHGALLDEDADKLLEKDGDFLIQSKSEPNHSRNKLVLAVKTGGKPKRVDIQRLENGFRIVGKSFANVKTLIDYYETRSLKIGKGEKLQLKHPIPKGKYQLNHSDIKLQKKIGSGAYGTVYKALLTRDGLPVAVKRLDSDEQTEQGLIDMMKEARVMQLYDHPNVVRFYGYIVDRPPYLLVMEFCKDGSVEDKLRERGMRISVATRVDMACQASRGVEYLHEKKCIHRDIATRNCLLSGAVLKLADFGMCRETLVYKIDLTKPQNVRWLAPEVWRTGETRFCTDIYAFAVTLWEFFEIPYSSPYSKWKAYTVREKVMAGYRLPSPEDMPDAVVTLMRKCWDHDPMRRPTAAEVRKELEEINKIFNDEPSQKTAIMAVTSCRKEPRSGPKPSISFYGKSNRSLMARIAAKGKIKRAHLGPSAKKSPKFSRKTCVHRSAPDHIN